MQAPQSSQNLNQIGLCLSGLGHQAKPQSCFRQIWQCRSLHCICSHPSSISSPGFNAGHLWMILIAHNHHLPAILIKLLCSPLRFLHKWTSCVHQLQSQLFSLSINLRPNSVRTYHNFGQRLSLSSVCASNLLQTINHPNQRGKPSNLTRIMNQRPQGTHHALAGRLHGHLYSTFHTKTETCALGNLNPHQLCHLIINVFNQPLNNSSSIQQMPIL